MSVPMMHPGAVPLQLSYLPENFSHRLTFELQKPCLVAPHYLYEPLWVFVTCPLSFQDNELRRVGLGSKCMGTCWDCECLQSISCKWIVNFAWKASLWLTFQDSLLNKWKFLGRTIAKSHWDTIRWYHASRFPKIHHPEGFSIAHAWALSGNVLWMQQ